MPNFISDYVEKWIREAKNFGCRKKTYSPQLWGFVSFVLPLALVPVAVKGATYAAKEIKKAIDKKKKK